jgi:addiction module RelE/StbE family toxin
VDHPKLYKPGRMKGTREMVIRPNYVVVYRENKTDITILRVLHAARQWP